MFTDRAVRNGSSCGSIVIFFLSFFGLICGLERIKRGGDGCLSRDQSLEASLRSLENLSHLLIESGIDCFDDSSRGLRSLHKFLFVDTDPIAAPPNLVAKFSAATMCTGLFLDEFPKERLL